MKGDDVMVQNDYILDINMHKNSVMIIFDNDEYDHISFDTTELTIVENC